MPPLALRGASTLLEIRTWGILKTFPGLSPSKAPARSQCTSFGSSSFLAFGQDFAESRVERVSGLDKVSKCYTIRHTIVMR